MPTNIPVAGIIKQLSPRRGGTEEEDEKMFKPFSQKNECMGGERELSKVEVM